ncbi:MAG: hypothetical protein PV340_04575 [Wolbachia sp.]|nr:hypothetical protein [Wolbachia sp.]MDD9336482.1 hypothetical protein [Wolbachia sp.]
MYSKYIKGKISRKLFQEFEHLRKRHLGQHLWQEVHRRTRKFS